MAPMSVDEIAEERCVRKQLVPPTPGSPALRNAGRCPLNLSSPRSLRSPLPGSAAPHLHGGASPPTGDTHSLTNSAQREKVPNGP